MCAKFLAVGLDLRPETAKLSSDVILARCQWRRCETCSVVCSQQQRCCRLRRRIIRMNYEIRRATIRAATGVGTRPRHNC